MNDFALTFIHFFFIIKCAHTMFDVEVQCVWLDPDAITIPARIKDGESRWMMLGKLKGKIVAVIFTLRAQDFDDKFENGEDLSDHLDLSRATKRVSLDLKIP